MDELQEMREQMAALKEKLNKQEIINEKNLRKLLLRKVLLFKIFMWIGILLIATPTVALWIMNFAWFDGTHTDFELIWGTIAIGIMLTLMIIGISTVKIKDVRSGSLKTVKEQISSMNSPRSLTKHRKAWIIFSIMVLVWFFVRGFEFDLLDIVFFTLILLFTILDIFIPGWTLKFGEWIRIKTGIKKPTTEWDEYIRQIEEMTKDDEEEIKEN